MKRFLRGHNQLRSSLWLLVLSALVSSTGCSLFGSEPFPEQSATYLVRKGDTLSALEHRFNLPVGELQKVNNISDPKKLQIGQLLVIPALGPLDGKKLVVGRRERYDAEKLRKIRLDGVKEYIGKLTLPVKVPRLTSTFGWRGGKFHEGLDLACPTGTKIVAAHDGRVVFESRSFGGYGRIIVVKGRDLLTVYAHNSRNRVSVGDSVSRGEWIADVGQTGSASGPHLHFETRVKDRSGRYAAVDPLVFFSAQQRS